MTKKADFGAFLSTLAQQADVPTKETLDGLAEKMKLEKQAQIEAKLRRVFVSIQEQVEQLRSMRAMEKMYLARIKELEEKANKIVAGEDDEEPAVPRVRRY